MTLTARFVAGLLATPVAQAAATKFLSDLSSEHRLTELEAWLRHLDRCNDRLRIGGIERTTPHWLVVSVDEPYVGRMAFRFIEGWESAAEITVTEPPEIDVVVHMACDGGVSIPTDTVSEAVAHGPAEVWIPPEWTAALLVEHAKPLYAGWAEHDLAAVPYFEKGPATTTGVALKRTGARMRRMLGHVVVDPGALAHRLDALALEPPFDGPSLLCSTFLPAVFESPSAVKRFYKFYSSSPQATELIDRKVALHRERWLRHLEKQRRVDVLDRAQLMEYFAAPDYYQMPLLDEEIAEQLTLVEQLSSTPNYEICLTPEAVDIPYEIYGGEVHIRSDRRNKGHARVGKISGLQLNDPSLVESFQREFWTTFEATEPQFRDKAFVLTWIREQVAAAAARRQYDVAFLGTTGMAATEQLTAVLEEQGLRCWRADRDSVRGLSWPQALEHCGTIGAVLVNDTEDREPPWADLRLKALLERIALAGTHIIIVTQRKMADHPLPAVEEAIVITSTQDVLEAVPRIVRAARARRRSAA